MTGSDLPISEAYKGIEWNPLRVKILQALYEDSPIFMQCNDSAGRRLPGDWSHMQKSAALQTKNRDSNRCYDDVSKVVNVEKTTRRKDNDNDQQKMYLAKRKDSSRKRGEHVRRGSSRQDRSRHSMRKRMDFFFGHVPN